MVNTQREMVHAMDDFASRLDSLMVARGLGVRAVARRVPCHPSLISRLRSGEIRPSPRIAQCVDDVLQACGELVALAAAEPGPGPRPGASELARRAQARPTPPEYGEVLLPWTVSGTLISALGISEVDPVDRRSFILLAGSVLTSSAHDWLVAHPAGDVSRSAGRTVEPKTIDYLDDMTARLRQMDDQMGGGSLIDLVRGQAAYVAGLLRDGKYTDSTGRRLHGTLAELLRLGGWVSFDSGDHPQAQRFWLAALRAAHTAGDRALGANVLGFMAEQSWHLGRLADAARLAETAVAGYKGASPRASALLHMRAARAHAMTGDTSGCRSHIDLAYSALNNSPPQSGEPGWSYWMDEISLNEQVGKCFLYLNDWPTACAHLENSLRAGGDWQESYARDGASVLIALASSYARAGEPEQACAIGGRAIGTLAGQVYSPRLVGKIVKLRDDLAPYRETPTVQEFSERAELLSEAAR
jgi:hypothetical protein